MMPTAIIDKRFYDIATSGWVGVDLFFVLSGFLITGILFDTKETNNFFRNFYIRRILRIFPLYYGTLVVFFLILPRIMRSNWQLQLLAQQQSWYWSYLVNVLIAFKDWPLVRGIGHFWSLAVEEQFYLFWPIIVFFFRGRHLMIICTIGIMSSLAIRVGLILTGHSTAAYVLMPARMDTLAVGALLALVARGPRGLAGLSRWAWPVAAALTVVLLAIFVSRRGLNTEDIVVETIGYTLIAFLFGAILIIAVTSSAQSIPGKVFASSALVFFGRYSYALYVFHPPILFFLKDHVFSVGTLPRLMGSQLPGQILFIAVATGVSVGVALLSWHFYEQPFLKLKNLFPYQPRMETTAVQA
jgi:peptidoglycan/LPS O-acetylase OafA/YrhL